MGSGLFGFSASAMAAEGGEIGWQGSMDIAKCYQIGEVTVDFFPETLVQSPKGEDLEPPLICSSLLKYHKALQAQSDPEAKIQL